MAVEEVWVTPSPSLIHLVEVPLAPISSWRFGSIQSVHVLPELLDIERFKSAVATLASIYPVIAGRLKRRQGPKHSEFYVAFTSSPIKIVVDTSSSELPPFLTTSVIQPHLSTYVDYLDRTDKLQDDAALISIRITHFPKTNTAVLGLWWEHILGDGNAFVMFSENLSKLYSGVSVAELVRPTFEPHVTLSEPSEEVLKKWDIPLLSQFYTTAEGGAKYGVAAQNSVVVQVTFTVEEVQLLKDLARGREVDEWVSEQDGLSSYWINLMRLCGVDLKEAIHSINYRSHCKGHPAFPPTLPTLCANVSQMHAVVLPSTSTLSLRPVALRIRRDLETMKHDADSTLEWLSARAFRMQQVNDQGKMQVLVPGEGECFINSNWRYEWNLPYGFDRTKTAFHTAVSILNFLRVFRSNDAESGAECTWNVTSAGLKASLLKEIARDRADNWKRWRDSEIEE